jgi:hypothetical protein
MLLNCSLCFAQIDFTALAMYLLCDRFFEIIFAEDVELGDVAMACLLQLFFRNNKLRQARFRGTGNNAFILSSLASLALSLFFFHTICLDSF